MTGWSAALLGRLDRGASLLARSLALRPGDEGTLGHYLGVLSARRIVQAAPQDPKLPGLVQRYLEARLEDEPAPALDRVLVTTLRAGLTPEAGAIYRLCKSRFPDLEIKPLVRGLLALEEGRREEAKEAFLEAVSGGPEPQKAAAEACSRLRAVGQPEACVEIFDRALERLPGDGPLSLAAAAVFLELGNRERGAKLLEDSLQASPELLALALPMIRSLQMDGLSDSLQDLLDEASLGTDSASSTIFSFLLRHYAITGQEQRLSALLARLARVTLPYFVEERAEQLYSLGFHSEATALLEGRPGTGGLSLGLHLLASGDSVHGRALIMDFLEKTFGEMPRFGDDQAEVSPPVMALFGGVSSLLWEAGLREQSLWVLERLSRQFPGSPTLRVQILARQLTKQPLCSEAVEDLRGLLNLPAAPLDGAEVSALVLRLHNAGCGPAILNLMAGEISVSRSPWWLATYVQQALRLGEEKIKLPNAEGLASLTPGVVANTAAALLRAGQRPQALALLDKHLEAEGLEESGPGEDDEEGSLQKARRRRGEENEVLVQLVLASTDRPLAFQRLTEQLLSAPDGSRHGTRIRLAGLATRLDLQDQVAASLRAALPLSNNPKEEALALLRNRLMVGDLPGARVAFASALTGGGGLETILDFYSGAVSKLELAFARELLVLGAKAFPRDQSLAVENLKILALEGEPQAVRQAWDALLLATPKLQQAELAMQFGLLLGSLGHEDLATGLLALATQPRGLAVRAMEAAEAGRLNQAQELVDLALSQSPSPSFLRAAIFEQLPARPEGLALASHLLNATAPNARAYTPAASYWAALDAGAQGNFQRALELALRSARGIESRQERFPFLGLTLLDSGMPLPQVQQIMNIYFHGLDRRQALAFLAQAMLDLDMEAAKSAGAKALLELTLGKARELLEDYPTDEWLISQEAELLRTLGRSQEAEATYRGALQRSPGDPGLMNNLAYLLALENRSLDEGLELAQRALVLDPSQVPFYRDTLGWLHHRRGEGRAAEAEVLAALKASDFSASQGLGECLFHLASIKAAAGDEGAALRWFRLALFKDAPGYLKAEIRSYLKTHSATGEVR
jgi:tetratricopeptide (TPR) repeat protein